MAFLMFRLRYKYTTDLISNCKLIHCKEAIEFFVLQNLSAIGDSYKKSERNERIFYCTLMGFKVLTWQFERSIGTKQ